MDGPTAPSGLEAIVAHGLLNSLAVMSGAADTILAYGPDLAGRDVEALVAAIDSQSCVFTEGLKVLLEHSSIAFADAATAVSLGSGVCGTLPVERRDQVLAMIVRRSRELRTALDGLVRGLPAEVLELLDSLNPPAINPPGHSSRRRSWVSLPRSGRGIAAAVEAITGA